MLFNQDTIDALKVSGYTNVTRDFIGTDCPDLCFDHKLFKSFPYPVSYDFNELGFRERSVDEFSTNPIIVLGDSATLGVGLPVDLRFTNVLELKLNHQVLNFSLAGASNDWISRKLSRILKFIRPCAIIIHYSFSHRREDPNLTLSDDQRATRIHIPDDDLNYANWFENHSRIISISQNIPVVFTAIPNWHSVPVDVDMYQPLVIDRARDGCHYGIKTSEAIAQKLASKISMIGASGPWS